MAHPKHIPNRYPYRRVEYPGDYSCVDEVAEFTEEAYNAVLTRDDLARAAGYSTPRGEARWLKRIIGRWHSGDEPALSNGVNGREPRLGGKA